MKTKRIQGYPNPYDLLAAELIECKGKVFLDTSSRPDASNSTYIRLDTSLVSPKGQTLIGNDKIKGQQAFFPDAGAAAQ